MDGHVTGPIYPPGATLQSQGAGRIRLQPDAPAVPLQAYAPYPHALRWRSPFPAYEEQALLKIFVSRRAFIRFSAHAGSDLDHEVGGGLVGRWRQEPATGQAFVIIDAVLPARHTRQGSAFLTFTQDTLVAMNDDLEARYGNRQLVGWYHTHPGMGVFLSGYDLWLHQHFFPQPWQVALVIEPRGAAGGFFLWDDQGRIDPHRYAGFYELKSKGQSSVVHWSNMAEEAAAGGEDE
jgi:proteasome lid subunit RPN8/RPN11